MVDTHAHLYVNQFGKDIDEVLDRAKASGVKRVYLPNIDSKTIDDMFELCDRYPDYLFPMLGLHPCDVKADFRDELEKIEQRLDDRKIYAIGEIGTDAHWDQTYIEQQKEAFHIQCEWALKMELPIVIHARDSLDMQIEMVEKYNGTLKGVFHCFTGNIDQAKRILDCGFYLGIGGVVTFKNSGLDKVLERIPLSKLVLETDSPYLAPVPYRGKRNESSYLVHVLDKLTEIYDVDKKKIEDVTSGNADQLFNKWSNN